MLRHLLIAAFGALAFTWATLERASSTGAAGWDFEASANGWVAENGTLAIGGPPHSGVSAGRLTSTGAGAVHLRSSYWLQSVEPGREATATVWVSGAQADFSSVTIGLEFVTVGGQPTDGGPASRIVLADGYVLATLAATIVPSEAVYARIVVSAEATRSGAALLLDDVSITQPAVTASPTSTSTPTSTGTTSPTSTATAAASSTPTASPSASPTATASATATATVVVTATATATRTATRTATPTATVTALAAPAVFPALTNGDFEDARGLYGWTPQGGSAEVRTSSIAAGHAAVLASSSTSTKWLHQAVNVAAGGWYSASARLSARSPADEAWVRLAWYATSDGSGSQLEIADSPPAPAGGGVATTGPVQAPPTARSVRVRLMLRPASEATTTLEADDVTLAAVGAPAATPTKTGTPPPAIAAGATSAAGPTPSAPAAVPSQSGGASVARVQLASDTVPRGREPTAAALIRITELLPNPLEPGPDADHEWIELANLGGEPSSLEGYALTDNAGTVSLPAVTLEPMGVLVVRGARADVGAEAAVHTLADGFSNGLGNAGDRLALLGPDGGVVDALSWGSDRAFALGRPEVSAPAAGHSILRRFADDGSLVTTEHSSTPTPGRVDDSVAPVDLGSAPPSHLATTSPLSDRGWPVLLGLAGLSLGIAGADRARRVLRER